VTLPNLACPRISGLAPVFCDFHLCAGVKKSYHYEDTRRFFIEKKRSFYQTQKWIVYKEFTTNSEEFTIERDLFG